MHHLALSLENYSYVISIAKEVQQLRLVVLCSCD